MKWGCKQVYWDTNSFLLLLFEHGENKKYLIYKKHLLYIKYFS